MAKKLYIRLKRSTHSRVFAFAIVGVFSVFIDYSSYLVLSKFLAVSIAKSIGFLLGTLFSFVMSRQWVFVVKDKIFTRALSFTTLYVISGTLNVQINGLVLFMLGQSFLEMQLAFILATGMSATINYIGMKHWVFQSK
jgi:putative flippase GtrA